MQGAQPARNFLRGARLGLSLLSVSNVEDEQIPVTALDKVLRTARLTIRAPAAGDAAATWSYRRLPSVSEWLTSLAKSEEEYAESFLDPARMAMTAVVELGGRIIGDLMIRVEDPWSQAEVREQAARKQVEIGYCLDPQYSGKGYATEAVKELLRYSFEDLDVHRVVASCFADNETSWRLMERLGMRRELHALSDSLHRSGAWHDSYGYALLQDEWRTRA